MWFILNPEDDLLIEERTCDDPRHQIRTSLDFNLFENLKDDSGKKKIAQDR